MALKYYTVADLSGGLNIKQLSWMIANNECVIALNCDFWTLTGAIMSRKLNKKINSTPLTGEVIDIYRFIKSDRTSYLIVQTDDSINRRVYYSTDNITFTLLYTNLTGVKFMPVDYEDWVYLANINGIPERWDGINAPTQWGITAPLTAPRPTLFDELGALTGIYTYKIVYLNDQLTRSPNSPISMQIVTGGDIVTLSDIPVSSDPQVTKKEIYRQGGLLTNYYLVGTIDNSVITFTDNIADIDAGALLDPYDRYPAPKAKAVGVHLNRIFVANLEGKPNAFTWSRARRPENFYDPESADPIGLAGKQIMWVKELGETVYFGKEESIYALRGADETTFYLDNTYVQDGTSSPSVCDLGTSLGYIGIDGFYIFNGISAQKITGKVDPIFNEIIYPSLLRDILVAYDSKMKRIYISLPIEANPNSNVKRDKILVIDFSMKAIHQWEMPHSFIYYDHDLDKTLIGDANGFVYELEAQYPDEASYNFHWMSKAYDLGSPEIYKNLYEIRLTLNTKTQPLNISLWADHQKLSTVAIEENDDWIRIPFQGGISGINFQLEIEGTAIKTPIIISPPIIFKYSETDVLVSNER